MNTLKFKSQYKRSLTLLFLMCILFSCGIGKKGNENLLENENVLRISDIPWFDTTGLQSIYQEVSPYEIRGIEPPEDEEDKLDERYNRPYSHFEFIENAHNNLVTLGYDVGSIMEFSSIIMRDSLYALNAFKIMQKSSTQSYLGEEGAFLDSVRNVRKILDSLVANSNHEIKEIDW